MLDDLVVGLVSGSSGQEGRDSDKSLKKNLQKLISEHLTFKSQGFLQIFHKYFVLTKFDLCHFQIRFFSVVFTFMLMLEVLESVEI